MRTLLVRIEDIHTGIFTLVKNAHDRQTELAIYTLFPSVVEFVRKHLGHETKRFVRVVKAAELIHPDFAEFRIVKDGIILPEHIKNYIFRLLGIKSLL